MPTIDEVFGSPSAASGAAGFPRVSAEEQAQRNLEAARILEIERSKATPAEAALIDPHLAKMRAADPFKLVGGDPYRVGRTSGDLPYEGGVQTVALSPDVVFGKESPAKSSEGWLKAPTIEGFKKAVGNVAVLGDMVLNIPAQLIGVGADIGARAFALGKGESRRLGAQAGQEGREIAAAVGNPLQKLMSATGFGKDYDESHVAEALQTLSSWIDKGGDWIEKHTKGALLKEDVTALVNVAMAAGGVAGVKSAASYATRRPGMDVVKNAKAAAANPDLPAAIQPDAVFPEVAKTVSEYQKEVLKQEPAAAEVPKGETPPVAEVAPDAPPAWKGALEALQKPKEARTEADAAAIAEVQKMAAESGATNQKALQTLLVGATAATATPFALTRLYNYLNPDDQKTVGELFFNTPRIDARPDEDRTPPSRIKPAEPPPRRPGGPYLETMVDAGAPSLGLGAGVAGMVLGKKGMPHPEMIGRLAAPLKEAATRGLGEPAAGGELMTSVARRQLKEEAQAPVREWADKAITRWLQKGKNEIADVEIPYGEGTAPLGDVLEKALRSAPAKAVREQAIDQVQVPEAIMKAPADEPVWAIQGGGAGGHTGAANALSSYLSHVGDYLRQNVDPAKLPQYDLVRAVKETAKNDARVAAEMDKASAASSKDLPVYKDYGDGMKWVELKLPERLSEEQLKGIKPLGEKGRAPFEYEAVGADGKAIKNSYTGDVAKGKTPEEAYLAGRLAEEGNQMGHCVGGYCEGVASGESKIYSLRDAKGKSHVTVEVAPPEMHGGFDKAKTTEPAILQIKGKQNRAPNADYLPYVQDFVKEGKWGEVGDLENTKLYYHGLKEGSSYPKAAVEAGLDNVPPAELVKHLKPGYYTEAEIMEGLRKTAAEDLDFTPKPYNDRKSPYIRERGSASTDAMLRLGLGAAGAAYGATAADNPVYGAILGGVLGGALPSMGGFAKSAGAGAEKFGGLLSTRIANKSKPMWFRAETSEANRVQRTEQELRAAAPFIQEYRKLPEAEREVFKSALLENDMDKLVAVVARQDNPALNSAVFLAKDIIDRLGGEMDSMGVIGKRRAEYFPRHVKDYEGLREALGLDLSTGLEKALVAADKEALTKSGKPLSDIERDIFTNQYLQRRFGISHQPGMTKPRGVREMEEKLKPFYEDPADTLLRYIREAVDQIETAKFFGRDLVLKKGEGAKYPDITASIGGVLNRELEAGRLKPDDVVELSNILHQRFAMRESPKYIQDIRNVGNIGLLGDVQSAIQQITDVPINVVNHGLVPTMQAVAQILTKGHKLKAEDFGFVNKIGEEFNSTASTAKALNLVFKPFFTPVDLFGKNVSLNSAIIKFQDWAKDAAGEVRLRKEYGEALGPEFDQLIHDLRNGDATPLVKNVAYAELSKVQPINKLEVPEGYAANPEGRILYWLHTYQLKQADIIRREVYNKLKEGDIKGGLDYAFRYATVMGLAGATVAQIQNWILGKDKEFSVAEVLLNTAKNVGVSQYALEQLKEGNVKAMAGALLAPPLSIIDDVLSGPRGIVKHIPFIGKEIESHLMGGKEDAAVRAAKRAAAETPSLLNKERLRSAREAQREAQGEEAFQRSREERRLRRVERELRANQ